VVKKHIFAGQKKINMKRFVLLFFGLISSCIVLAQTEDLFVKSSSNGLYIDHKVTAKQGLYAIGRIYNVHPKFIAAYNKIDLNAGLALGQIIRIPLTDTNFIQSGYSGTPVYYRVGNNISLQKVSQDNNNVPLELLKEWNNLKTNSPRSGVKLIVGFIQSAELPSITIVPPAKQTEPEKPNVEVKPAEKPNEVAKTTVKEEPIKEEVKPVVKEEPKAVQKQEIPQQEVKPVIAPVPITRDNGNAEEGGFFKLYFAEQVKTNPVTKNEVVTAGIFKTNSGVKESKYYMLIDGVTPGTIVKIINPDNNKAIYAKVLGEMSGIRQNQGLDIRISSAAASVLGITDTEKFIVRASY
jgi:LysM repeat protein